MSFGSSPFGSSPYGGGVSFFQVLGARAVNPFTVVVTFSDAPDLSVPATVSPASYSFAGGISALQVLSDPDPNSIRIITTEQQYKLYTVTVQSAVESVGGATVDPLSETAEFTGFPLSPRFSARAQSPTAINLLFKQPMLANPDLIDPANYTLRMFDGTPLSILEIVPNTLVDPTLLTLKTSPLPSGVPLTLTVSSAVKASDGRIIQPNDAVLTWYAKQNRISIPLAEFTGEVRAPKGLKLEVQETLQLEESLSVVLDPLFAEIPTSPEALQENLTLVEYLTVQGSGLDTKKRYAVSVSDPPLLTNVRAAVTSQPEVRSTKEMSLSESLSIQEALSVLPELPGGLDPDVAKLFGQPNGLVFFSPSLKTGGAPTSSIQVDDVKACTQAYDVYQFPQPIDPKPLYTHGGGLTPTPEVTTLNNGVLFVEFYRLGEAKHTLRDKEEEEIPAPVDIGATFIFTEQTYPPDRVALLSNPSWKLFDNTAPPPYPFITADNLSPIPSPSVTYRRHYVNPAETLQLTEGLQTAMATSIDVAETLTQSEDFDLVPGENVVQVNISETLTLTEGLQTKLGVNLFETLTLTEGISVL